MPRSKPSTSETAPDAKIAPLPPADGKIDRRRAGWNARCTICSHPNRAQIELALARGASRRSVGAQYDCSDVAARRHFENHVSAEVKASLLAKYLKPSATIEAILAEEQPGLIERLAAYRAGLWHQYNIAVEIGDRPSMPSLVRELVRIEELIANQTGELRARASAPVQHLHIVADMAKLRQAILTALKPYPDALRAVVGALRTVDAPQPASTALIEHEAAPA